MGIVPKMSAPSPPIRACDFTEVVRQVQRWVEHGFYPGAGLLIGRGDQIVLEQYFGLYGVETQEFIASGGKWLAASVIAALVDQGALSWDDTVGRWLPQFVDDAGEVTLRQLLSHTSGFAPQQPRGRPNDDYQTLEESVSHIATLPLADRPGTRFRYGGLAMQVAGRMAELATGQTFDELFQRLLAQPLGLERTRFTPVDSGPGHSPMLAGGARSSARDYARFLSMILNRGRFEGKQILSESIVDEMQCDQVGEAKVETGEFVERARGAKHNGVYGLGLWRERVDPNGRAIQVSSPSWAGTYPWIDKQRNVYGVLIAHVDLKGPPWDGGFNPFYSSSAVADMVGAAVDRCSTDTTPL
jgi:CubicO group peptidase (beta-lactamase class C family)